MTEIKKYYAYILVEKYTGLIKIGETSDVLQRAGEVMKAVDWEQSFTLECGSKRIARTYEAFWQTLCEGFKAPNLRGNGGTEFYFIEALPRLRKSIEDFAELYPNTRFIHGREIDPSTKLSAEPVNSGLLDIQSAARRMAEEFRQREQEAIDYAKQHYPLRVLQTLNMLAELDIKGCLTLREVTVGGYDIYAEIKDLELLKPLTPRLDNDLICRTMGIPENMIKPGHAFEWPIREAEIKRSENGFMLKLKMRMPKTWGETDKIAHAACQHIVYFMDIKRSFSPQELEQTWTEETPSRDKSVKAAARFIAPYVK